MHEMLLWTLTLLGVVWLVFGLYVGLRHTRRSEYWQKGRVDILTKTAFLSVCTVVGFPMFVVIGAMIAWGIASEAARKK
jgi:hypothetical protein